MVRVEKLVMQGFKSFAEKVIVPFSSGFIVVAGPNGSGKSNIVDALTFVLGVTSARHIRAQKLQNLIFNGAKSRRPSEYCDVTIHLDNSDRKIPGYEKEIAVSRRITRSGLSTYRVNGKTVNKAKVLDLLSNANLSPDGHNIIMQGDVTRIIEMSAKERKEMIDDVSGITEFNQKKEESLRRLEKVELRVREAMIIVSEKESRYLQLKAEKESAEKYQVYNQELRKATATIIKREFDDIQKAIADCEENLKLLNQKFGEASKDLGKIDQELDVSEKELKKKSEEIFKGKDLEAVRNLERLNGEMLRKKDRILYLDREIEFLARREIGKRLPFDVTTFSSAISVPNEYSLALQAAIGGHAKDLIVKDEQTAKECIAYLKSKHLGRARFLPLTRIKGKFKKEEIYGAGLIGMAIDLISFEEKYRNAVEYVLGNTLVVDNMDNALDVHKKKRERIVTLDGELIEKSGAMIGGHMERIKMFNLEKLKDEREQLVQELELISSQIEELKEKERDAQNTVTDLYSSLKELEKLVEDGRKQRKKATEERFVLQNRINQLKIDKARYETKLEDLKKQAKEYSDVKEYLDLQRSELEQRIADSVREIKKLGPVNMRALEEFSTFGVEFEEMKKKLNKLLEEKQSIINTINEVETKRQEKFMSTLKLIADNFVKIYNDLTGGQSTVRLEIENNIDSGLIIEASPPGKKVLDLDSMSGGEKTMTSLAFLFAIMQYYSSPFYILDEVDAALDKPNTKKISNLVKKYSKDVQFIVISHNDITASAADKVFGVTMVDGASKIYGLQLPGR